VAGRSCRALSTRAGSPVDLRCRRCQRRAFAALQGRPGGAEPPVGAASAGGPLPAPYTSKRHPIKHRLFCHVERRLSGVIPDSPQTALDTVQRTQTQTGLTVAARLLDTVYELGRKCSEIFLDITDKFIRHDPVLGKWNYVFDANDLRDKMYYLFLRRYSGFLRGILLSLFHRAQQRMLVAAGIVIDLRYFGLRDVPRVNPA